MVKTMQKKNKRPKKIRRAQFPLILLAAAILTVILAATVFARSPAPPAEAQTKPAESGLDWVFVPAPVRAIAKGEKLSRNMFTSIRWDKQQLNSDYLLQAADIDQATALTPLPARLPVPLSSVSRNEVDANAVVDGIPVGFRAITVRVDAESAVEGWARSGNYVDVIMLRQGKASEEGIEAKVVAENVRILSAERSTEPLSGQASAPAAPTTVTLLVSQEDALKIKTAQTLGKLTFSLRGTNDSLPTLSVAMNQKTMLGSARTVIPKKQRYRGRAKGPDGKTYVLGEDANWMSSAENGGSAPGGNQIEPQGATPDENKR